MIVGIALAASLLTANAQDTGGEFLNGNQLLRYCSEKEGSVTYWQSEASCTTYIMGAHDALISAAKSLTIWGEFETPLRLICVPGGVEAGQLRDIVIQRLQNQPQERDLPASMIVHSALLQAYPCSAS
jgi:hypothetical protein